MLTTAEAAAILQVSRRRVLELIRLGTLKATRFGIVWQVEESSVEAYKNSPRKAGRKSKKSSISSSKQNIAHNIAQSERKGPEDEKDIPH